MTHDIDTAPSSISPLTDDQLAALVRDTADGWGMPPLQLDRRRWPELVERRGRRFGPAGGALRAAGRAAVLALALIVVAAAAGVVLTRLRSPGGVASIPTLPSNAATASTRASVAPSAHPVGLGSIGLDRLLVRLESGYAMMDLAKGTAAGALPVDGHGSLVRQLDDGSLVCICLLPTTAAGSVARYTVEWRHMDSSGATLSSATIGTYTGTRDPRGHGPDAYENAMIELSSGDSDTVYVGWSTREHPTWHNGLVAVDITSGDVLQRIALPDRTDGPDSSPVMVTGPRIVGPAGSGRLLIDRAWYSDGPSMGAQESGYQQGFEAFVAPVDATTVAAQSAFDGLGNCGRNVTRSGSLPSGAWWAACLDDSGTTIRRFAADDHGLGDTRVNGSGLDAFAPDSIAAIDPTGASAYEWNAYDRNLVKVDLETGAQTVASGTTASSDVLGRIGDWLAPAAAAKVFVSPSFAASPDGSRGYALGTTVSSTDESTASTGIYVFDLAAMQLVAHWPATADFQSIATNSDGSLVFLAAGTTSDQPSGSSLTVLDAETGAVRTTVPGLGFAPFFFTGPRLP